MSLASATQTYESKAKAEAGSNRLQPVLKPLAPQTRELRRASKFVTKDNPQVKATGWEYFLNPLEYE
jgi:hypothetical protein